MTRVLSELLGHTGPSFQLHLQQLENGAGRPSHDIRLTAEVLQGMQTKLRELGLDFNDTKGHELYATLGARLQDDERRFSEALRAGSPKSDDPIAHVALALERETAGLQTFALKSTVARKLLKANLPKKSMKLLGYRSADSMLKHESIASLFAAGLLIENDQWQKKLIASYGKLKGSDFESRKVSIEHPVSKRWQELASTVVAARRHNIVSFKELGTVVLLPLPERRPELVTLTTAIVSLHAINEIYAASTFLKLQQVQPNFGAIVKQVVEDEPVLSASILDKPVSWNIVQKYYSRVSDELKSDLFEPVLHMEDFVWHSIESMLTRMEPGMQFWQGTEHLAMLEGGTQGTSAPVSCNLTDAVLSHCNKIPYEARISQYFRHNLTHELTLRYLNHDRLEQSISSGLNLQPQQSAIPAAT